MPLDAVRAGTDNMVVSCFFQAEDGIRYWSVTGVQTCALPISPTERLATSSTTQAGQPRRMCGSRPRSRTSHRRGQSCEARRNRRPRRASLLDDRLRNCVVEVVLQRSAGRLHEHDDHHLLLAVHPPVGAVSAIPAVAAVRLAEPRVHRAHHYFAAQAEPYPFRRAADLSVEEIAHVVAQHGIDGPWAQDTLAVQLSAIGEHLRELQVVLGRAGKAGGAGKVDLGAEGELGACL